MSAERELLFASDQLCVGVLPDFGARLHRLWVFGVDLLRTPADIGEHGRDPFFWGAYHMAPWCNRATAGTATVAHREVRLESNFRDGSAIHGLVYAAPWAEHRDGSFSIAGGGNGWPWTYELHVWVSVEANKLSLHYVLANTSDDAMPAGLGLHPWFTQPLEVRIPAARVFPVNDATEPTPQAVEGDLDLRAGGELPEAVDASWVDLSEKAIALMWPTLGLRACVRWSRADGVIVCANPSDIDAVAVEPQTHAPDGIGRLLRGEPYALDVLAPSKTLRFAVVFEFERCLCTGRA